MWWFSNKSCMSKARLVGKTVVITGANTGIGKETARDLYRRGARVILACRDLEKANAALEDLKNNPPSRVEREQFRGAPGELAIYRLDLSSLKSVKECAKNLLMKESAIHILVNNAGVMMCPYAKTEDHNEMHLQTNYLGHFLLTLLLLPKIQSSAPDCRIVNVASTAYLTGKIQFNDIHFEKSYQPWQAYAQSKLANILFTRELARRMREADINGINVYTLHPGVIKTELGRHISTIMQYLFRIFVQPFSKNPEQGAQTTIYCSVDEKLANETGLYYQECCVRITLPKAKNDQIAKKLWDETCKLLNLESNENLATFVKTVARQIEE